ncbi:hypothetical protein N234_16355 [Ralstonia pickettii DTP0602]|nr:hypothetical protein N234_16355 [Ralstonia pickettii DTP0602]
MLIGSLSLLRASLEAVITCFSRSGCALARRACRSIRSSMSGKAGLENRAFAYDEAWPANPARFNVSSDVQLSAAGSCCSRI